MLGGEGSEVSYCCSLASKHHELSAQMVSGIIWHSASSGFITQMHSLVLCIINILTLTKLTVCFVSTIFQDLSYAKILLKIFYPTAIRHSIPFIKLSCMVYSFSFAK